MIAVGVGTGVGVNAWLSRCLGEKGSVLRFIHCLQKQTDAEYRHDPHILESFFCNDSGRSLQGEKWPGNQHTRYRKHQVAGHRATVTGQIIGGLLGVWFNSRLNREIQIRFRGFRPDRGIIGHIYSVGLPSIILGTCPAAAETAAVRHP